ncbi:hypothetical protein Leryth_010913 [Lithospermum erythrorhizon]|nr:hypothetical protein Leryth_010913 [Lithospermum erythrorhizon]
MAPNPKVKEAFRAMEGLGITEEKVKPVLKKLIQVYEKNWELIEAENYRVLADAIFDFEESKPEEDVEREAACDEETERPLKRLRRKCQEVQTSSQVNNSKPEVPGALLTKPKEEPNEIPSWHHETQSQSRSATASPQARKSRAISHPIASQPLSRNKEEPVSTMPSILDERSDLSHNEGTHVSHPSCVHRGNSDSISLPMRLRSRGKQTLTSPNVSGQKTKRAVISSRAIQIEEQKNHMLLRKEIFPVSHSLIKPKGEPFTNDLEEPIPICLIDLASESSLNISSAGREQDTATPSTLQAIEGQKSDGILSLLSETKTNDIPTKDSEKASKSYNIASSQCGSVKINLSYDMACQKPEFRAPSLEAVLQMVSDKYKKMNKVLDSGFSLTNVMEDVCNSFLRIGNGPGNPEKPIEIHDLPNELVSDTTSPKTLSIFSPFNGTGDYTHSAEGDIEKISQQAERAAIGPTNCQSLIGRQNQRSCQTNGTINYLDISKGQEVIAISLVNDVNKERPPFFHYIPENAVFQHAYVSVSLARIGDKNCCSSCSFDCLSLSLPCACAHEIGGDFAYTKDGLVKESFLKECISMNRAPEKHHQYFCKECPLERAKCEDIVEPCKGHLFRKFIKECWWKCGCGKQCGNRVVQRGISHKLQVFMTPAGKGWGLRTLEDLPKGAFVCEYVGEVLTNAELFDRVEQRRRKGEKHSYPVLLDADWSSEGVLKDEEALCLDATKYGNVARFINHRCHDANMVEIPVEIETPDHHYYHLAFFTSRKVKAMEELTWDYGIDFDDIDHPVKAFSCHCSSKYCRNIKRTKRTRSSTRR